MAVIANWLQNVDYPARIDRVLYDNLWEQGVIGASSFAVTQTGTPSMAVDVAAGVAVITGTDQSFQGKYLARSESVTSALTITAAPGSGERYDIVIVQVRDTNAGGPAGDDARVFVVVGTPSATPVDPAIPTSSIPLARVRVPAGTGSITNALIDNLRVEARLIGATPPSGTVSAYAGATTPTGYLLCDGTAYSTTLYPALYAIIGSLYATSGGQTAPASGTFRVPLMTGRVAVGRDATQSEFDTLGETGGSKTSTAPHTHPIPHTHSIAHDHASFNTTSAGEHAHSMSGNFTSGGTGDHTHGQSDTTNLESHQHEVTMRTTASTSHSHTGTASVAAAMTAYTGTQYSIVAPSPDYLQTTINPNGYHFHGVDVAFNISSQGAHAHAIDVPDYAGTSGPVSTPDSGASSASAASGNLQPYTTLNYIIKT
jgi:microcystin-dependent protein